MYIKNIDCTSVKDFRCYDRNYNTHINLYIHRPIKKQYEPKAVKQMVHFYCLLLTFYSISMRYIY